MRGQHARPVIAQLERALSATTGGAMTQAAMQAAIEFLTTRLTEAAIDGCHHCDEVGPPSPCRWCGLLGVGKPEARS
jgi:hypothetical protein